MKALTDFTSAPAIQESLNRLRGGSHKDINETEPLVALVSATRLAVVPEYSRIGLKNAGTVLRVRESVKTRLEQAASLLPPNTTLIVMDGWRSASLQQELYDYFNAKLPPSVDRENYIFNPSKVGSTKSYPTDAPPHRTGGSVDVMLGDGNGEPLTMGAGYDEMTPLARTAAFEESDHGLPSTEAQAFRSRRRVLMHVMSSACFSNYPEEFWHYDFGNSFWRFYSGIPGSEKFGVTD